MQRFVLPSMIQRSAATSQRKAPSHCQCRRMNMPPTSTGRKPSGRPWLGSPTRRRTDALSAHAEFVENLFVMLAERRRRCVDAWAIMRKRKGRQGHTEITIHSVAARMAVEDLAACEVRV